MTRQKGTLFLKALRPAFKNFRGIFFVIPLLCPFEAFFIRKCPRAAEDHLLEKRKEAPISFEKNL